MARFGRAQVGAASQKASEIDHSTKPGASQKASEIDQSPKPGASQKASEIDQSPKPGASQKALEINSIVEPKAYHGGFLRRGQSWFCITGLPSNLIAEVDEMLFHLHQLPLISRSGKISRLVADATSSDDDESQYEQMRPHRVCRIQMHGIPGGAEAFELVAKFCYGVKVELMASNVATLRCAAEYLDMTEEYGEQNLIALTESFLDNVIIRSWKHSVKTLKSCETLLPLAEELSLVRKCVDSIALKVCAEPSLYGWPMMNHKTALESPSGKLLWNGSRLKARPKNTRIDWWYEDVSILSLPLFKCVIHSMEEKGLRPEAIAGALMYYARKFIPGMHRRQEGSDGSVIRMASSQISTCCAEQLFSLKTIESLLPLEKGTVTTAFLSALLKVAMILNADETCRESLEKRVGAQLEQATVDDILIPNYSDSSETLYDVECVLRIVQHFFDATKALAVSGDFNEAQLPRASSSTTPLIAVAKLIDAYLAEIASDVNLTPAKFQAILGSLPHDARQLDDGMYRAIDIFLKAHPSVDEGEIDALCNTMNCEKLTQQACEHAAQNKRLPLRVVARVLFLEQAQLRAVFAGALEATTARNSTATPQRSLSNAMPAARLPMGQIVTFNLESKQSQVSAQPEPGQVVLRADLTGLHHRITELERECVQLRQRLQRKAIGWASLSSKLSCRSASLLSDTTNPRQRGSPYRASHRPR